MLQEAFQLLSNASGNASCINRDLLVAWVASGLRPFTIVEDKEFRTLLNSLEPRFPVPGRVTVARRAAELHM